MAVECPACNKPVRQADINNHLDSGCTNFIATPESQEGTAPASTSPSSEAQPPPRLQTQGQAQAPTNPFFTPASQKRSSSTAFFTPAAKRHVNVNGGVGRTPATTSANANGRGSTTTVLTSLAGQKRSRSQAELSSPSELRAQAEEGTSAGLDAGGGAGRDDDGADAPTPMVKRTKTANAVPLAERMRPESLDDIEGQELVARSGILRSLITSSSNMNSADRGLLSMILWGASGTGKTTIARCIARLVSARFVELNATSTGVGECKKLFAEAESELRLLGRRTIIFCDEIHRFSKSQQDVFLRPVEAGTITLIGATTENPSFKIQNALLSRCRTFTLQKLTAEDVTKILRRALAAERERRKLAGGGAELDARIESLIDDEMLGYLSKFSDGDARTALNLLEMALSLVTQPDVTKQDIKTSLTQTLVYDRAGDQHYDTISAFHKSVRGGDADAALYYLARMLQSGEDPLYVSRRMVVIASEDVGLADSTMLQLATSTHTAVQQLGMPEARIPLAHCAVALTLAPKSTRAYRGLNNATTALREPGVAGLPVPMHLRNAPTKLMREMGCGAAYKYPPNYVDGRVSQTYLPDELTGRRFLEERHLGTEIDPDLEMGGI